MPAASATPRVTALGHAAYVATTSPSGRLVTSLDVLDDFFGGFPRPEDAKGMTLAQFDELGERVETSAADLSRTQPRSNPIGEVVYPGGWLGNHWQAQVFRTELNSALLYEPRLLVHDPLAEYFFSDFDLLPETTMTGAWGSRLTSGARMWADVGRRVHRGNDLDALRVDLGFILRDLGHFEPLIRSGVIVMRSQFPTIARERHALDASVRADLRSPRMVAAAAGPYQFPLPRWDNLRGAEVTPPGGLADPADPTRWEPELYYLAKTLMFSRDAGAFYAPSSEGELALLEAKSAEVLRGKRSFAPGQRLITEALRAIVPDLRLDPATAVELRRSEEAFGEWRRELREMQRATAGVPDEDIPQLVQDVLQPKIDGVRRSVSRSPVLSEHVKKNVSLALIAGVGAAPGGTAAAAVATVATGVGGYLMDTFGKRRPDGSKAVIAALLHHD